MFVLYLTASDAPGVKIILNSNGHIQGTRMAQNKSEWLPVRRRMIDSPSIS